MKYIAKYGLIYSATGQKLYDILVMDVRPQPFAILFQPCTVLSEEYQTADDRLSNKQKDSLWPWSAEHPPSSWRQRYIAYRHEWFDKRIGDYRKEKGFTEASVAESLGLIAPARSEGTPEIQAAQEEGANTIGKRKRDAGEGDDQSKRARVEGLTGGESSSQKT